MTKEDYMHLPKARLAELLAERDDLEEKIEDLIAEKFNELFTKLLQQPLQTLPNIPIPNDIVVLYGCPTPYPTTIYATSNTTNQKDDEK